MEMLFVIGILGVASLLFTRLFAASMRVVRTAPQAQTQQQAVDRLAFTLRRDVWNAKAMDVTDARTIDLTQGDENHIRWTLTDDGAVRTAPGGEQKWAIALPLRAERQGPVLVLRPLVDRVEMRDEMRFISQLLMAGEKQ
jgi:hypothetical protein